MLIASSDLAILEHGLRAVVVQLAEGLQWTVPELERADLLTERVAFAVYSVLSGVVADLQLLSSA